MHNIILASIHSINSQSRLFLLKSPTPTPRRPYISPSASNEFLLRIYCSPYLRKLHSCLQLCSQPNNAHWPNLSRKNPLNLVAGNSSHACGCSITDTTSGWVSDPDWTSCGNPTVRGHRASGYYRERRDSCRIYNTKALFFFTSVTKRKGVNESAGFWYSGV